MAGAPDPGFPWGPAATAFGVVGSIIFNIVNYRRTNALKTLDHLNTRVRAPVDLIIGKFDDCTDKVAVMLADSAITEPAISAIGRDFSNANRALERKLQDAQRSDLIPGQDWVSLRDDEYDRAAQALEDARRAVTGGADAEARQHLAVFQQQVAALRQRLLDKIDTVSRSLM